LQGSCLDRAAILGCVVVVVAIGSVFTGFGAALGLSTISATPGEGSFNLMLILSAIWVVVTLFANDTVGGDIAGRMRRRVDVANADEVTARDGLNGLVVWGLGVIVSVFVLGKCCPRPWGPWSLVPAPLLDAWYWQPEPWWPRPPRGDHRTGRAGTRRCHHQPGGLSQPHSAAH
jgi:hypothetical protein